MEVLQFAEQKLLEHNVDGVSECAEPVDWDEVLREILQEDGGGDLGEEQVQISDEAVSRAPANAEAKADEPDLLRLSTLDLFVRNAKKVPLLTAADEVALAKRIERGDLAARNRMVEANVRLAVKQAYKYRKDDQRYGLQLIDLVQEGCLGLVRAAEKFEWRKGFRFSTYAMFWVDQAMTRAIADKSREIRQPVSFQEKASKIRKTEQAIQAEQGTTDLPSAEAVAARTKGIKKHHVDDVRQVSEVTTSLNLPVSVHQQGRFDDAIELGEIVTAPQDAFGEAVAQLEQRDELQPELSGMMSALESLSKQEQFILKRLVIGESTIDEVANDIGLSQKRVSSIKAKALSSLKKAAIEHCVEFGLPV